MSKEDKSKYNLVYPSYITPDKQIWIIEKEDRLKSSEGLFEVVQVIKPQISGVKPKLVIKQIAC
jgi:hypothetical protein